MTVLLSLKSQERAKLKQSNLCCGAVTVFGSAPSVILTVMRPAAVTGVVAVVMAALMAGATARTALVAVSASVIADAAMAVDLATSLEVHRAVYRHSV